MRLFALFVFVLSLSACGILYPNNECSGGNKCKVDCGSDCEAECTGTETCEAECKDDCILVCHDTTTCNLDCGEECGQDVKFVGTYNGKLGRNSAVVATDTNQSNIEVGADSVVRCGGQCNVTCGGDCEVICEGECAITCPSGDPVTCEVEEGAAFTGFSRTTFACGACP